MTKSRIVKIPDEPRAWSYRPPDGLPYHRYRALIRDEFGGRCAYCLTLESLYPAGEKAFQLDHYRPKSKFPKEARRYRNLRWACAECNRLKGMHPYRYRSERGVVRIPQAPWLPDIMTDHMRDHIGYKRKKGIFEAKSERGAELIRVLNLNADYRVRFRLDLEAAVDLLHAKFKVVKALIAEKRKEGKSIPDEILAAKNELQASLDRMTKEHRSYEAELES